MTSETHRFGADARAPLDVMLRPLTIADKPAIRRWMADPGLIRFTVLVPGPEYGPVTPYAPLAADRYLETLVMDPGRRSYAIVCDGEHVGNVGLKEYDPMQETAECFIEIGSSSHRGGGVGRRAMQALLDIAFFDMTIQVVRLGVFEFNLPAIRLYHRLGFHDDGRYGWHWAEGRYWEVHAMAIEPDAWRVARAALPRG